MPLILNGTTGVSGIDGSAGTPSYQGGDTNTGIFYPAADTIAFAEGGVESMRITSAGNVGIGTTIPNIGGFNKAITVSATGTNETSGVEIQGNRSLADTPVGRLDFYNSTNLIGFIQGRRQANANDGSLHFYTANAGTNTERVVINSSGVVGINAFTNLRSQLEIRKASISAFTGTTQGTVTVSDSGATANNFIPIDFSVEPTTATPPMARIAAQRTVGGSYLYFGTSNLYVNGITNNAMIIDPNGLIGAGNTPSYRIQAFGAQNQNDIVSTNTSVNTSIRMSINDSYGQLGVISVVPLVFLTSDTERMRINTDGSVACTSTNTLGPYFRGNNVSVADGGTINITVNEAGGCVVSVYNTGSGNGGLFWVNYSGTVTKITGDGSATDTGTDFAVYKNAGAHLSTFKNRSGGTANFAIGVYSAKAQK